MKFKLAILNVLARSPGSHLTLDEVRRAAELLMASEGQTEQLKRFSTLGSIDIFQSGLVLQDDAGLQITDAGRTLLHSLESASEPSVKLSSATSPSIDASILDGTPERNDLQPYPVEESRLRLRLPMPRLRALPNSCSEASVPRFKNRAEALFGDRVSSRMSLRKCA